MLATEAGPFQYRTPNKVGRIKPCFSFFNGTSAGLLSWRLYVRLAELEAGRLVRRFDSLLHAAYHGFRATLLTGVSWRCLE